MVVAEVKTPFADKLESTLSDNETHAILGVFDKIGVNRWLAQNPFKEIRFVHRSYLFGVEVNGWYSYQTRETEISTIRNRGEWGENLDWGRIDKLSYTGRSEFEAVQFTVLHELGHHLHACLNQVNKLQFQFSLRMPRTNAVSTYAKKPVRPEEYFAETFAAWVLFRVELFIHDELGYGMIERALKVLGIEVQEYELSP